MKPIRLNESDIRSLIKEIINEVYMKGRSVSPADAQAMIDQFVQAYESEGPDGPTTKQIYGDIWGFAMTALKSKVQAILGSQFDSFYYPEAVDNQFIAQKDHTMQFIVQIYRHGNKNGNKDVMYNLAIAIANKLRDVLAKNATRSRHHVMAADTRVDGDNGTTKDIMDTIGERVPDEEEVMDILEKMKLYLQSYSGEMPNVIKQILEDIINGIEQMHPNVKEEIMSMDLTGKAMQQMILMTALGYAEGTAAIPYPELQMIVAKYRRVALGMIAQRNGGNPNEYQASPKDIKNAVAAKNPSGVLVLKTENGDEKQYAVNDVMSGIDTLIYTRTKLSRLKKWFAEHDLDFEKMAQSAREIAESKKTRTVRLTESQLKALVAKTVGQLLGESVARHNH